MKETYNYNYLILKKLLSSHTLLRKIIPTVSETRKHKEVPFFSFNTNAGLTH